MTYPGIPSYGRPPLDHAAAAVIEAARNRFDRPAQIPPPRLSVQEKAEVARRTAEGAFCGCCGGFHAGTELACPRLASFKLDGDGSLREGTYWPDGQWDTSRVLFAADAAEPEPADE